ncbi:MAG: N-acetyltransferase, partial [Myxococcales bacterium]|nr:N-acetyltransferase [Myxococcales bacterium]
MRESEVKKEAAIELRVFGSFAKIEPLWASLEGWQDHPSLWPAWLSAMEETGCVAERKGWVPYHLGMFDGGELLAAAPCYVKLNSEGEFIFDHGLARSAPRFGVDYFPKLLVASPFTPTNGPRLLVAKGKDPERARHVFAAALASLTGELEVSSAHTLFLPEADAVSLADKGLLHRYSVQFHFTNPGFESYEDFLKTLPSKRRTKLRRERRYPSAHGITIETETGDALT